jgi:hypothetical protein
MPQDSGEEPPMRRARIETLERRAMFSVTDLIIDPFNATCTFAKPLDEPLAIIDYVGADEVSTPFSARTESVGKDETITIHGKTAMLTDIDGDGMVTYVGSANGGVWKNGITHIRQ